MTVALLQQRSDESAFFGKSGLAREGAHHCGRRLHSHLLPEWLRAQRVHRAARRLLPVARGLPRALPRSCPDEDGETERCSRLPVPRLLCDEHLSIALRCFRYVTRRAEQQSQINILVARCCVIWPYLSDFGGDRLRLSRFSGRERETQPAGVRGPILSART